MNWWRLPLSSEPYRYTLFLLLSIPLAIWSLVDRGAEQNRLAAALLRGRGTSWSRVRGLVAVPLDAVTLVVAGYLWLGVPLNLALPARPLVGLGGWSRDDWGGPTLAGVWAVHALGGIACWLVVPWILRGYVAVWRRMAAS